MATVSGRVGAQLKGKEKMRRNLELIMKNAPREFGQAVFAETKVEELEVKRNTPVDKGDLQESVRTEGPYQRGRRIVCAIIAGSAQVFYAWIVHEDLEAFHRVGKAKYLEDVLKQSADFILARIASRIDLRRTLRS